MTIYRCAALAAVLLLAAPKAGRAVTEANFNVRTTGDLVELCEPGTDSLATAAVNFCHGFAQGAISIEMEHQAASRGAKRFCLPTPPPTRNEGLSEFVKWARVSPDRMSLRPVDGLIEFLEERFPCSASR
jgi:hypothetical protein